MPGCRTQVGKRPGSAAAHDLDLVAGPPAGVRARRELADRQPDRALLLGRIGNRHGMAFPAHQPDESQAGLRSNGGGELRDRRARRDAGAIHADIDLDHDAQPPPPAGGSLRQLADILDAVDRDDRIGACARDRAGGAP